MKENHVNLDSAFASDSVKLSSQLLNSSLGLVGYDDDAATERLRVVDF